MFREVLGRIAAGEDLSRADMEGAVDALLSGQASDAEIGLLLTGLRLKGETVEELVGAASSLRRHMTAIRSKRTHILDTCGTGGDASGTFNISTAAALVAAAAGVPVAKHGNRRATSRSGSADVLAELGVNVEADLERVARCLDELGICFCFAPLVHGAMKQVAAVRKQLGTPTIFNLIGPLANPAGAEFQLIGVGRADQRPRVAGALAQLGIRRAAVVHGDDGLDEVTLCGATEATLVDGGRLIEVRWTPQDFGLPAVAREGLLAESPSASAAIIRGVLAGEPGGPRAITLANAAAALWLAGEGATLSDGARRAAEAIDRGDARELLSKLISMTNG